MKKDWTNLGATLNQITKVQPNFINVWSNQAWNLAYNVSVEFDDYRQRYRWVIKGIDFLKEGIKYNERQPRLQWDMGWTISQKIGKADEQQRVPQTVQGRRRLPRVATHGVARQLAGRQGMVRPRGRNGRRGRADGGQGPADLPLQRTDVPDELCREPGKGRHLRRGGQSAPGSAPPTSWQRYGNEEIPTSFVDETTQQPIVIRLNDQEMHEQTAKQLVAKLDALQPGLREKMIAETPAALTTGPTRGPRYAARKTHRQAISSWPRRPKQAIAVTHNEVARRIKGPKHDEAIKLAKQAANTNRSPPTSAAIARS